MHRHRLSVLLCAASCALLQAGVAHAGGAIRGYVLLPSPGRVAFVDVEAARVFASVSVPPGAGPLVASVDGTRVLVANTRLGLVTQLDGIRGRPVRTFRGLGRPVALALVPSGIVGLVRTRYAVIADARGWIDVLDLAAGRVVSRRAVARPTALAIENGRLWVASAGELRLTRFDLIVPTRPRFVTRVRTGVLAAALTPFTTSSATGVEAVSPTGELAQVDGYSLASTIVKRLAGRFTQIIEGYDGVVWTAATDGHVFGVLAGDAGAPYVMRVPRASQLQIVGGWLAASHGYSLSMFALGTHRAARTIHLPGSASAAAFAVLP